MQVNSLHPTVTAARREEWSLIRDCMDGASKIKSEGEARLPKPPGFGTGSIGAAMYADYNLRAQFPELLAPSVSAMIGTIHGQEIAIEMPDAMNYLWENADGMGLPLEAFHRRITRELLTIGGYGVLADAPEVGGDPWLAGFRRESIINWDENWFVLDETGVVREDFEWVTRESYRVLQLMDGIYGAVTYDKDDLQGKVIEIRGRGDKPLPRIPFAIANALDLSAKIETPPLIGVANLAMGMFFNSADYESEISKGSHSTLVAINGESPDIVGPGTTFSMMGSEGVTPDLKYVTPPTEAAKLKLEAMKDKREAAVMAGARLFEQTAAGAESGEAKRLRYASETATLTTIAQSSCMLLERSLRNAAMIMGLPENDIVVNAPADLMDRTMSPQDFAALFGVYVEGGISWETLHENGVRGGIYSTERTADQEYQLLDGPRGQAIVA